MKSRKPLAATLVAFCRFVRANGIPIGPKQTVDPLQAAKAVGVFDRASLMAALRAVLCSSKEEWDLFDELFEAFWNHTESERPSRNSQAHSQLQARTKAIISFGDNAQPDAVEADSKAIFGAGKHERLTKVEFSEVAHSDL